MIDLTPSYLLLILAFLALLLLIQLVYFLFFFLKLVLFKPKSNDEDEPAVSVVICAKNELENLQSFLPQILNQQYSNFEVVVVNDCSWDGSFDYLKELAIQFPRLRIADIKEVEGREHGKKFALTIGIKAAKHDVLLLTDADCYPSSENWIKEMISSYQPDKKLVLGYSRYEQQKGFLNLLIRWETFFNGVLFLSKALVGRPYMGLGRNLSYKKQDFFANKGFAAHMHLISGDDDLFVQTIADSKNTAICISKDAITVSKPKQTFKTWFRQKKRHHSTAAYYKSTDRLFLWLYPLSLVFFYAVAFLGLVLQYNVLIIITSILFRALLQICILHSLAGKLAEKQVGWMAVIIEPLMYLIIMPIYKLSTFRYKKNKWK